MLRDSPGWMHGRDGLPQRPIAIINGMSKMRMKHVESDPRSKTTSGELSSKSPRMREEEGKGSRKNRKEAAKALRISRGS